MSFLSYEMIKVWIAPIVTGVIVALIVAVVTVLIKRKNTVSYINTISAAEDKLIEILRPFFIQELELTEDVLIDSRRSIIREYKLMEEQFISIQEIKEIIILDILKTRFIKEEDKKRLIESTYKTFNKYKESIQDDRDKDVINLNINKEVRKNDYKDEIKVKKYNDLLASLVTSILALISVIVAVLTSTDSVISIKIFNNIVSTLGKMVAIFSSGALIVALILILYKNRRKSKH